VSHQESLWYDTPEDAMRALVDRIGGFKRVAADMWPEKDPQDAGRLLAKCLDNDRPEKLSLEQVFYLMRQGRQHDCHTVMQWLGQELGYNVEAISMETERERLQRQAIAAVASLQQITAKLEALA